MSNESKINREQLGIELQSKEHKLEKTLLKIKRNVADIIDWIDDENINETIKEEEFNQIINLLDSKLNNLEKDTFTILRDLKK